MQPDITKISIDNNQTRILLMLDQLVFSPRLHALQWSDITKQTPSLKIGYPGQHLASLIVGMEGERTAARGNDICDGTEIKACNRIDQLDKCKDCGEKVMRVEAICPHCNSTNIKRNRDSKWLFSVKSQEELDILTVQCNRIFLLLFDYPNFENSDFDTIEIQAFEIWNNSPRCSKFKDLMEAYYNDIYLFHIAANPNKTPAPYNLWPDYFPFFQCNPIKVFDCIVTNANVAPSINIQTYIEPHIDRNTLDSIIAPVKIITADELREIRHASDVEIIANLSAGHTITEVRNAFAITDDKLFKNKMIELLSGIDENLRHYIPLRTMNSPRITGAQPRANRGQ